MAGAAAAGVVFMIAATPACTIAAPMGATTASKDACAGDIVLCAEECTLSNGILLLVLKLLHEGEIEIYQAVDLALMEKLQDQEKYTVAESAFLSAKHSFRAHIHSIPFVRPTCHLRNHRSTQTRNVRLERTGSPESPVLDALIDAGI